ASQSSLRAQEPPLSARPGRHCEARSNLSVLPVKVERSLRTSRGRKAFVAMTGVERSLRTSRGRKAFVAMTGVERSLRTSRGRDRYLEEVIGNLILLIILVYLHL